MAADLSSLGASFGYGQAQKIAKGTASEVAAAAGQPNKGPKAAAEEFAKVFDKADAAVGSLARGEGNAQAVVEAMAEAELALKAAVTVRDKVVEAYQDILRMPV